VALKKQLADSSRKLPATAALSNKQCSAPTMHKKNQPPRSSAALSFASQSAHAKRSEVGSWKRLCLLLAMWLVVAPQQTNFSSRQRSCGPSLPVAAKKFAFLQLISVALAESSAGGATGQPCVTLIQPQVPAQPRSKSLRHGALRNPCGLSKRVARQLQLWPCIETADMGRSACQTCSPARQSLTGELAADCFSTERSALRSASQFKCSEQARRSHCLLQ